jgi:cytochrome c-type biogenesis protein CcmH/NrfG
MVAIARVDTSWAEEVDAARFPVAETSWAAVADFDPTDWEVHDLYAAALNSWANAAGGDPTLRRRTAEELTAVVRMRPTYVIGWVNLAKVQWARGELGAARGALQHALALDLSNPDIADLRTQLGLV